MWYETQKIFCDLCPVVPKDLYILHFWNKFSQDYTDNIKGFDWAKKNYHTLYGKLLLRLS
jgi:hypothetical protein